MKTIIVGLGIQGNKRKKFIKKSEYYASVDNKNKRAEYHSLKKVPTRNYNNAILCIPDNQKNEQLKYLLKNNKNVMIEKPLKLKKKSDYKLIEKAAKKKKLHIYTAYNHRFEPHIISIKNILKKKKIGKIYSCRLFYGNGTSKLVRKSNWKDKGNGVIDDLCSHLIDICIFWFGIKKIKKFKMISNNKFENKSIDHAVIVSNQKNFRIELEATYCMWKNTFSCDILGSKGSLHIDGLCKWGPSMLKERYRTFPSGRPKEIVKILKKKDPTWKLEYNFFKKNIKKKSLTNLKNDLKIFSILKSLR